MKKLKQRQKTIKTIKNKIKKKLNTKKKVANPG